MSKNVAFELPPNQRNVISSQARALSFFPDAKNDFSPMDRNNNLGD
jgi:hypothetical protein